MIFSKFFKNAWQSKDSNVRIAAIDNELSPSNQEHLAILNDLLIHDENELVRRAVLLKLNDFETWWRTSKENSNAKIKAYAKQQIADILLGQHAIKATPAQKQQLLAETNSSALLEAWLFAEKDCELVISLYKKLAKPQLLTRIFAEKSESSLQLALLEQVDDKAQLEKLGKRSQLKAVKLAIEEKIALIIEQEQKPIKIAKDTQLVLAKLLALKDVADYEQVIEKKQQLVCQWQANVAQFSCLTDCQQQSFQDKYQEITQQLEKIFAQKAEAFEQQKIAQQLAQQRQLAAQTIENKLSTLEQSLSNSIFTDNSIDEASFIGAIEQVVALINQSTLSEKQQADYLLLTKSLQHKLKKLPEIAASVTSATHLISKISQLALPEELSQLNEKEALYQEWLEQFKRVANQAQGALPESITQAYQQIIEQWQQALSPLQAQRKQLFFQAQRKLSDVKRLISLGKFNAAFGVYKKADSLYRQLSDKQQARLTRDHQFAQQKIAELSDWEHYIATPRKQELLDEIKALVERPFDNPVEQAAKVKAYRKQWNSLGHADDDKEQSLNQTFNQMCEQAFAPCRLYYAEQEKIREQHLQQRQKLLSELALFSDTIKDEAINWKQLDSKLHQFKQNWRVAGEVERSQYKALNSEFNSLLAPLKSLLDSYHQENIVHKQQLINQAQECVAADDIDQAINQLKRLQTQWREIGYCGAKHENRLWQEFRELNDQVFARRNSKNQELKEKNKAIEQQYAARLAELVKSNDNVTIEGLNQQLAQLQQLMTELKANKGPFTELQSNIVKQIKQVEQAIVIQQQAATLTVTYQAFELLEKMALANGEDVILDELPHAWRKKLSSISDKPADATQRLDKTILLEIIAGIDSPSSDKERRLELQLALMQQQMSSGQTLTIEQAFDEWLALGALCKADKDLLTRIRKVFTS